MGTFCCTLLKGINMFIHQNTHFSHFHKIKHMNPPSTPRQEVTLLNDQKQNGTHKKMMMCGGMLFCSSQICLGHSGFREGEKGVFVNESIKKQ